MFTKKLLLLLLTSLLSALVLIVPGGCRQGETGDDTTPVQPEPKRVLVSSTLIGEYTADQLRNRYSGATAAYRLFVRYGIKAYRLVYTTTGEDGKEVQASGALLIPDAPLSLPLFSVQHGTILSDDAAPSNYGPGSDVYTFGSVFASTGYIIAAPDYIGYGASKNLPHPYEHNKTLASASLDMLRASREFIEANAAGKWDKRLFIAGYSEGGYATLALQKKLEEEAPNEFNLVASSCGAGAYDKTSFMKTIIGSRTAGVNYINRLYVWVLLSYDRIYKLNRPMTYYFKEPYAAQIAAQGFRADINVSLNEVFTDSFKKGIQDGTDKAFLDAVRDNDIYDWKPKAPTQLYHGTADDTVLFLNSKNADEAMRRRGSTSVTLIPMEGRDHATGVLPFVLGTYSFFSNLQ